MMTWFSLEEQAKTDAMLAKTTAAVLASSSPTGSVKPLLLSLNENERIRRLCTRIRITPFVYLKCSPERKEDERFALAAMLGMEQHTHRREEVMSAVAFHCPNLFTNPTCMSELFLHGDVNGVEDIIMRMCTSIAWDRDLALVAIHRTPVTYRYLPKFLQTNDQVIEKLLEIPSGGLYLGRCAPRALLISQTSLVLRALQCGFSRSDIPLELLMSKEFILQAVKVDSCILTECSLGMISDWEVLMAACTSDHCHALSLVEASLRKCRINPKRVLNPFAEHVKSRLDRHFAFQTFLNGISIERPGKFTPLQYLNCAEETSIAFKRQIADFLGESVSGKDMDKYKKAWDTQVSTYYYSSVKTLDGTVIKPRDSYHHDLDDDEDSFLPISRFLRWGGGLTTTTLDRPRDTRRRRTGRGTTRRIPRRLQLFRHVQIALGMEESDRGSESSSDSDSDDDSHQVAGQR